MNIKFNIEAGGIFSKYMFAIQNSINYECDLVYLNITDDRTLPNAFDFVLNQKTKETFVNVTCENLGTYDNENPIELSSNLDQYRMFIKKMEIKPSILNLVKKYTSELNITEKTIGIHLRLTDMNIHHAEQYGVKTFDDFVSKMDEGNEFFVSSDNHESIEKLKTKFPGKIKYLQGLTRCELETDDSTALQLKMFKDEQFWIEAFIEMLLLSQCGKIICRTSNLVNCSIIYSEKINQIIRI